VLIAPSGVQQSILANLAAQQIGSGKLWSMLISINFNGNINKIEEKWEIPIFLIQDGGFLFTK